MMGVYTYTVTVEISIMASLKDGTLPQHAVIGLLGIYPKDTPSYHKDTCSTMSTAALLITARNWKHLNVPQQKMDFLKNVVHLHNGVLLSSLKKKNHIMKFSGKWMELGKEVLSEVTQKDKYGMHALISGY